MEKIIPLYYKRYADYVNKFKMLPNAVDGTIPVYRRLLLTLHQHAPNKFAKSPEITGNTTAKYHPFGDPYGSLVNLVQNGFAIGDGNFGFDIGILGISKDGSGDSSTRKTRAAAARYTSVKANPVIEDMAFKYIRSVEWKESEMNPQPDTLPIRFPLCLFGKNEFSMIAIGFKTDIPTYELKDLKRRLFYLLGKTKTEPVIAPNIKNCTVVSSKNELKKLLTTGTAKIKINGTYEIDKVKHRVYIKGWNPRINFDTLLNKIDSYKGYNLLSSEDIGFLDESDYDNPKNIRFEVLRKRNTSIIFDKMVDAINNVLEASLSYNMYAVDDKDKVRLVSVDEMLLLAYNHYTQAFIKHNTDQIEKYKQIENEYDIIDKIRPYISESTNKSSGVEMIKFISLKSGVKSDDIKTIIDKYKIKKLLSVKTDKSVIEKSIKDATNRLNDPEKYILEEYKNI